MLFHGTCPQDVDVEQGDSRGSGYAQVTVATFQVRLVPLLQTAPSR